MVFTFNFTCRYILYLQSFRVRQTLSLLHGWFSYKFLVLREVWSATFLLSDWWWILINNLLKSNNQRLIIPAWFFLSRPRIKLLLSIWQFPSLQITLPDNLYPGKKKVRYWMFLRCEPATTTTTTTSHGGGWGRDKECRDSLYGQIIFRRIRKN